MHDLIPFPDPEPATPPAGVVSFQDWEGILVDGEFLVRDISLARKLGLERPRDIRREIDRQMEALAAAGGALRQRAVMIDAGGAKREIVENYLNEIQALMIAQSSDAHNRGAIQSDLMNLFAAFYGVALDHSPAQNFETLVDRDMALQEATFGVLVHEQRAKALKASIAEHEAKAAACRKGEADLAVSALGARQRAERHQRPPGAPTLFAAQLGRVSLDACVLWILLDRAPGAVDLVEFWSQLYRRFCAQPGPAEVVASLERLASMGLAKLRHHGSQPAVTSAAAVRRRCEADAELVLDALDGPGAVFGAMQEPRGGELGPLAAARAIEAATPGDAHALPAPLRMVRAIFALAADHRIRFVDGIVAVNPLARDRREALNPAKAVIGRPSLGRTEHDGADQHGAGRRDATRPHPRQVYRLIAERNGALDSDLLQSRIETEIGAAIDRTCLLEAIETLRGLGLVSRTSYGYTAHPLSEAVPREPIRLENLVPIDAPLGGIGEA